MPRTWRAEFGQKKKPKMIASCQVFGVRKIDSTINTNSSGTLSTTWTPAFTRSSTQPPW